MFIISGISINGIIHIMRSSMATIDLRLSEHCEKTAFIFNCMLKYSGKFKNTDIAYYTLIGLLHDIGAYKTNQIEETLDFEFQQVWDHSIYGYLYLRYLSPLSSYAEPVLYHHTPPEKLILLDLEERSRAASDYLRVADRIEHLIRNGHMGKEHASRYLGKIYSREGIELFRKADRVFRIVDRISDGSYKKQLDVFFDGMETNDIIEKNDDTALQLLEFWAYSLDFRHENTMLRTITASRIAQYLCKHFRTGRKDKDTLLHASLLYDLGMLAVPASITNSGSGLSFEQRSIIQSHVRILDDIVKPHVGKSVYQLAVSHHERLDGSGYPKGLEKEQLNLLQRILMVADVVAAMSTPRADRLAKARSEIITVLNKEKQARLCPEVCWKAIEFFDDMMDTVNNETEEMTANYFAIKKQFGSIMEKFYQLENAGA